MKAKEHPILFSTPMVKAILEGRKTQTRRVIKSFGQYTVENRLWDDEDRGSNIEPVMINKSGPWKGSNCSIIDNTHHCPYGTIGDILWVRETFKFLDPDYAYKADFIFGIDEGIKWKPSIFMPRKACRILLEIINIKVERLQDISPGDACDEGISYFNIDSEALEGGELVADFENYTWKNDPDYEDYHFPTFASCIESYRTLWQKINGKESWNENPWVWVIEFKIINHS